MDVCAALKAFWVPVAAAVIAGFVGLVRTTCAPDVFAKKCKPKHATTEDAKVIRAMICHENELINHRLTWLLVGEGFLFNGIATAWGNQNLVTVLSYIGSLVALSTLPMLIAANKAIDQMVEWWHANRPSDCEKEPDVIGYKQATTTLMWFRTWLNLPAIIVLGWSAVLYVNFTRADDNGNVPPEQPVVSIAGESDHAPSRHDGHARHAGHRSRDDHASHRTGRSDERSGLHRDGPASHRDGPASHRDGRSQSLDADHSAHRHGAAPPSGKEQERNPPHEWRRQ